MRRWFGARRRQKRRDPNRRFRHTPVRVSETKDKAGCYAGFSFLSPDPDNAQWPLIDKYGHRHRISVLKSWSPEMLRIMQIAPVADRAAIIPTATKNK
jgi:hypothetical protein